MAIVIAHPKDCHSLAGGSIKSIDEFMFEIKQKIITEGLASQQAIPEQYPLLRTLQLALNGYHRVIG